MPDLGQWLIENNLIDGKTFEDLGTSVWLPEGIKIKDRFVDLVKDHFERSGFVQVELPFLIPANIYKKQPDHFKGLAPITYSVQTPDYELNAFLRTTSETPFTYLFGKWISNHSLPFEYFQVVSVFRHEAIERIKPLLRSREITPFIESYSALGTNEETMKQVDKEIGIYSSILNDLSIPFMRTKRPKHDTFPEALYTVAFDVILPNGEIYQICTVHHLGTSFAEAFGLRTEKGGLIFQTSTGISGRAIGIMLALHRQGSSVILPNKLSVYGRGDNSRKLLNQDITDQEFLYQKAMEVQNSYTNSDLLLNEAIRVGFVGVLERPHCAQELCMDKIKDHFSPQISVLGIALDLDLGTNCKCEFCHSNATATVRLALGKKDYH